MTRYPNWPARLEAFLARHQDAKFRYGTWDCCLFVCDAIEVMTGVDPAADFRGRYHSRAEAPQAIRDRVGSPSVRRIADSVTAAHGMRAIPVLNASRGDLALIKRPRDYSLGSSETRRGTLRACATLFSDGTGACLFFV